MAKVVLNHWLKALATSALGLFAAVSPATAAVYTLADDGQNSQMVVDTGTGSTNEWFVDGTENLFDRGWYVRVGAPAVGNPDLRLDDSNFDLVAANHFDVNFIPGNEGLALVYQDPGDQFIISLITSLTSGAPGSLQATFTQSVRVDNTSNSALAISLILYADYDLLGSSADDAIAFTDPRVVTQVFDTTVHEASVTVTPTAIETSFYDVLLDSLNDGDSTILNGNASAVGGDLVYAFQWDLFIAPGRSFTLGNTNSITVPEVSTMSMLGVAAIGLFGTRLVRRRK